MSELSIRDTGNEIPVPRSLEELWGYFKSKEEKEPLKYKGYADIAAEAADAIQETRMVGVSGEPLSINLALVPGRSAGIYEAEQTDASRALTELLFAVNNLAPTADETTPDRPTGRVLWQSLDAGNPVNLVETRSYDRRGILTRLTVVSDIPEDLLNARTPQRIYPEATQKAIKRSRALQSISSRAIGAAREAGLDYYEYVKSLPVAGPEIPND
ncbi:MAG TPA: hypothetical protein VHD84_02585 [Candidatus Saccharimonadales bacterium]|nr:hypothetical protein [Candidatus Saccharimonadales bacterium]